MRKDIQRHGMPVVGRRVEGEGQSEQLARDLLHVKALLAESLRHVRSNGDRDDLTPPPAHDWANERKN